MPFLKTHILRFLRVEESILVDFQLFWSKNPSFTNLAISSANFKHVPVNIFQFSFLHLVDLNEFSSMRVSDCILEHGNIPKNGSRNRF